MRVSRAFVVVLGAAALAAVSCSDGGEQPDGGGGGGVGGDAGTFDVTVDGARPQAGTVRLAVPAYFVPGPEWQRLIAAAPTVGMIIFNPASGPGTATDPAYAAVIAQAQAADITVLGYVATDYGHRAEADVLADINRYYDLYTPSGIYLAEGPMEADCTSLEAQYHRFSDAVRARDSGAFLSVGTRFCPTYIFFFDLMVQFARNWQEYQTDYTPPSWMPANSPQRFAHFVNTVPRAEAGAALSRAIANGAGWMFVTEGTDPNPWGALPSYWDQELATLNALQAPGVSSLP